jgi:hypothetical protein
MAFCKKCGDEVDNDAKFCTSCGQAIIAAAPSSLDAPNQRTGTYQGAVVGANEGFRWKRWDWIAAGVIVVLLIVIASIGNSDDSPATTTQAPTRIPTPTLTFAEAKSEANRVDYDDLFRNNEQHVGQPVLFQGEIIQVMDAGNEKYQFRVNVTPVTFGWDDAVLLRYEGSRFLEDDVIEFFGRVNGLIE